MSIILKIASIVCALSLGFYFGSRPIAGNSGTTFNSAKPTEESQSFEQETLDAESIIALDLTAEEWSAIERIKRYGGEDFLIKCGNLHPEWLSQFELFKVAAFCQTHSHMNSASSNHPSLCSSGRPHENLCPDQHHAACSNSGI